MEFYDAPVESQIIQPESTVSRNFIKDERFKAMLFAFAEGEELTRHTSSRMAVIHVVEGSGKFTTDEKECALNPGRFIVIEPNEPHSVFADTDMKFYLYLVPKG